MKTKKELMSMLFSRLSELQDGRVKEENPEYAKDLAVELGLLYDILDDKVPERFWEQIEKERYWYL